jgi:hypothetical protein
VFLLHEVALELKGFAEMVTFASILGNEREIDGEAFFNKVLLVWQL